MVRLTSMSLGIVGVVVTLFFFTSSFTGVVGAKNNINAPPPPSFPGNYSGVAQLLIDTAHAQTNISKIEYLCDTFGPRYRGTPNLLNAIQWINSTMNQEGLENVATELVVNITNWQRGVEWASIITPRVHNMSILGLGTSVGTGGSSIVGEIFVAFSFDDLAANASKAQNKIVLWDVPFTTYGETVQYRVFGASAAAKVGAIASLVRSITPFSLYTPHTGVQEYEAGVPQIPTAAVTVEDAEMMTRMFLRGETVTVELYMGAQTLPTTESYNIIAEVVGSTNPEEIVVIGGHVDSWDVGQGAMDDGGGIFSAWEALRIIHDLVEAGSLPRPRRTIRVVMWVDEEIGQEGAAQYVQQHLAELPNHVLAVESDSGNFKPVGFGFSGTQDAFQIIDSIGEVLLSPIEAGTINYGQGADADNGPLGAYGVPLGSLQSAGFSSGLDAFYFFYHHTNADTITALDFDGLRNSVAAFSILSYVVADMEPRLPFGNGTDIAY
eukprot:TRINITY_DN124_c0_g3_i1.p1 TRINITY_DN124_c0_g3~~TRINITY_DN124_c0_g3_i1.p1  ORF type:complete len:510 (+),score=128.17 TRINITY_DN124_c0_g3_i1:51-1532(+)